MPALDLPPTHLLELRNILDTFAPDAEVWAFGSRVNAESHGGSDLDLALRNPAQLDSPQPKMAELRTALQESNLPILVDILDWARLTEEFRHEIDDRHVVLRPPITVAR
jgi:predicted nucleotidyltransferase